MSTRFGERGQESSMMLKQVTELLGGGRTRKLETWTVGKSGGVWISNN